MVVVEIVSRIYETMNSNLLNTCLTEKMLLLCFYQHNYYKAHTRNIIIHMFKLYIVTFKVIEMTD